MHLPPGNPASATRRFSGSGRRSPVTPCGFSTSQRRTVCRVPRIRLNLGLPCRTAKTWCWFSGSAPELSRECRLHEGARRVLFSGVLPSAGSSAFVGQGLSVIPSRHSFWVIRSAIRGRSSPITVSKDGKPGTSRPSHCSHVALAYESILSSKKSPGPSKRTFRAAHFSRRNGTKPESSSRSP